MLTKFLLSVAAVTHLSAQTAKPDSAVVEAMRTLDTWVGEWKGQGWAQYGQGERHEFTIDESIQRRLEGALLLIEGRGRDRGGALVHNALAILSYDPASKQYRFRSWRLPGGQYRDSEATLTADGLEWGFHDSPNAPRLRFRIRIEGGKWFETGESSFDGQTWRKFMEMTLERVK
jgi:L-alanine-DL-glutamate epimerase-like enolase superfamily enzyme